MIREFRSLFSMLPAVVLAAVVAIGGTASVTAQGATPDAPPTDATQVVVQRPDEDGVEQPIGTATFSEANGVVTIQVEVAGLEPGDHGIHIHEIGICDPAAEEPYATAGGHFNPTGASHGPGPQGAGTPGAATPAAGAAESHAGDLGNITVGEDGTGRLEVATDRVTLETDAEHALADADADGSALVIHQNPDDLQADPSRESGPRIACGVIFAGLEATPVAVGHRG